VSYTYGSQSANCPGGTLSKAHAVVAAGSNTYCYDLNGNMAQRNIGNDTHDLAYDEENHLIGVSGTVTTTFGYDGDGKRVLATQGVTTTVYVGNYYEMAVSEEISSTVTYYYAGAVRLAMRENEGDVQWLLGDHLGSTSIVYDGTIKGQGYKAWGERRFVVGGENLPTTFRYTGQREEADIGLYYYGARWYDPGLGRFVQADSIVPGIGDSQAWDRYAYVFNNPIKYNDPTGYRTCDDVDADGNCITYKESDFPELPAIPENKEGGDPSTPWIVGWEWLTGTGPRRHIFFEGDPFTELLQEHEFIEYVRELIIKLLREGNFEKGVLSYNLGGLEGILKYLGDYSTLATLGKTGNLAVTFLGGYRIEFYIADINFTTNEATILFHVYNASTLGSLTHPPYLGYTDFWIDNIYPFMNNLITEGPMSEVEQDFYWYETIDF